MKIAVFGGEGFIGSMIGFHMSGAVGQDGACYSITRKTYGILCGEEFDVFINVNGSSKKYLAEKNPLKDFRDNVTSVYKSLYDFKFQKYIYISSTDAAKNNIYGFHKMLAEQIVERNVCNNLILRCPAVIGKNMTKGVLFDILNDRPLYVTPDSEFQFITNREIADSLIPLINQDIKGRFVLGSKDSIKVEDIGKLLGKEIRYRKNAEKVLYRETNYCQFMKQLELGKSAEDYIKEVVE